MTRKRRNSLTMDFYGTKELLDKIAKAGGRIEPAIETAVKKGMVAPKQDMIAFMDKHYYSGDTEKSMTETPIEWRNGQATYMVGYDIRKGGRAAIYLDVGAPTVKPYFFIRDALENNIDKVMRVQQDALEEIFRELM